MSGEGTTAHKTIDEDTFNEVIKDFKTSLS